MIVRRTFLKSIGALPFLFSGKEDQGQKTCNEVVNPEVNSKLPIICAHWRGRWWRAQGNKIEWSDPIITKGWHSPYRIPIATDDDFVNWNILAITFDYCEALIPHEDVLLWIGKRDVWEIELDYCYGIKEFMFQFRYKGFRSV